MQIARIESNDLLNWSNFRYGPWRSHWETQGEPRALRVSHTAEDSAGACALSPTAYPDASLRIVLLPRGRSLKMSHGVEELLGASHAAAVRSDAAGPLAGKQCASSHADGGWTTPRTAPIDPAYLPAKQPHPVGAAQGWDQRPRGCCPQRSAQKFGILF